MNQMNTEIVNVVKVTGYVKVEIYGHLAKLRCDKLLLVTGSDGLPGGERQEDLYFLPSDTTTCRKWHMVKEPLQFIDNDVVIPNCRHDVETVSIHHAANKDYQLSVAEYANSCQRFDDGGYEIIEAYTFNSYFTKVMQALWARKNESNSNHDTPFCLMTLNAGDGNYAVFGIMSLRGSSINDFDGVHIQQVKLLGDKLDWVNPSFTLEASSPPNYKLPYTDEGVGRGMQMRTGVINATMEGIVANAVRSSQEAFFTQYQVAAIQFHYLS